MGTASRFFTGRQDILEKLDAYFCARNTGGRPRREFLLHGMTGVGKSEIAFKFAEMFDDDRLVPTPAPQ
jgi:Holliday junction resolvasome RuvABC ATP-dependent DNA helicase subunit